MSNDHTPPPSPSHPDHNHLQKQSSRYIVPITVDCITGEAETSENENTIRLQMSVVKCLVARASTVG